MRSLARSPVRFDLPRVLPGRASAAALVAACALAGACRRDEPQSDRSRAREVQDDWTSAPSLAGAEACLECHEPIAQAWSRTGMARALGPIEEVELAGLASVAEPDSAWRYALATRPDAQTPAGFEAAIFETRDDDPEHLLGARLAFAIGAGRLDRSYAAVFGDFLWFAPLEVVRTGEGRRAALSPVHALDPGRRFSAPITPECLGCHTDALPPSEYPLNALPDAASGWTPRGIGCAACHPRAGAHAAWQRADDAGVALETDPISHPAWTRAVQMSVCAACHLQGDARIVLDPIALGPPEPGNDLLDERAVFVAAEPSADVGFVSQVERLVLSRCFLASSMTCVTCHDPHRSLDDPRERARVRAACTTCHETAEPGTPGSAARMAGADAAPSCARTPAERGDRDCASCHLPRMPVFDVADVEIHDHWIRQRPDPPSARGPLRFAESPDGDWRRFTWPGATPPEHVDDPGLWLMALASRGHDARAAEYLDSEPGPRVGALPMYHHVRAGLLEQLGRPDEAIAAYEVALERDDNGLASGPSATNLGLLLGRSGRNAEGLAVLTRLLERRPRAVGALRNRAILQHEAGRTDRALADLAAAYELLPSAEIATLLAEASAALGQRDISELWLRRARALGAR